MEREGAGRQGLRRLPRGRPGRGDAGRGHPLSEVRGRLRRVMSIEDFLSVHGPETTGAPLPAESAANLDLAMLVKMASNGMPVAVDTTSPEARAALARGQATFYRRVGERNHACADCHTPDKGANKFLGGRLLADVTAG